MKVVKISYNEMNYLKDDGSYFLDKHAIFIKNFDDYNISKVIYKDYTENFIDINGKQLLKTNAERCYTFMEGFALVRYNDNTCNFINSDGKQLLKNNVFNCFNFYYGSALIYINNIYYHVDKECNFYNIDYVSFKELYKLYPNKRQELIEIIDKYTYHNIDEYFK